ncbi:hypothetical protein ACFSKU_05565 [Pontibacter silvestris]|uniref:STAS/SEC14 domain-containing protein n=1 Tax=Pontibacter silvestris TaxID=2305183 RepID=A0ABW4WVA3_9BACT|nr:hypothetical protein [Pontibacter silvestris]MCC9137005.1 hypothetical protein [Pontibacter silvestris]
MGYIYKEFPFLTVEVDEEKESLIMNWAGSFTSGQYREAVTFCMDLVASKGLKFWLANSLNIGQIQPDDQRWTSKTLLPRLSELGVKKVAIVVPEDLDSHMAIAAIMVNGKEAIKFDMHYFVKRKEAEEWFKLPDITIHP